MSFIAACIQNCAGPETHANIEDVSDLVRSAHEHGANLVCTPEFFACLHKDDVGLQVDPREESAHPALNAMGDLARELGVWLLLGSIAVRDSTGKCHNRSVMLDDQGRTVSRYDKIHMFDVDLPDGERYRESDTFTPGETAVVVDTPWARLGLSVCYDLRFPYLYRHLAQIGAQVLTVPAAFTKTTGQAHWHTLLRSRAIETGCYVIAPCQFGVHGDAATYGHSLIIDPWGTVLADGGEDRGIVCAEIDLYQVTHARQMIPALKHDREIMAADEARLRVVP
jgi:predicted amidohydrolase